MSAKLGTCAQATRVLLILLNIIFLLLGIGLIAGGSVLVATGRSFQVFSGILSPVGVSAIIIVAGIFTFIVSALGILGAIFKSRVLLGIYLIVVALVIILEVVAAAIGIVKRGELGATMDNYVARLIEGYGKNNTGDREAIDFIQDNFKCCGWNNSQDYTNRSLSIPESCDCTLISPDPKKCTSESPSIWVNGCRSEVVSALHVYIGVIIAIGILFALIELLAVFCACGLCCCIHRGLDENNYTKV